MEGLTANLTLDETTHGWKAVRCPFHPDMAASASYNTTFERFRCHACGVSGDGYDLIQEVERCDFATSMLRAVELCGPNFTAPSETGTSTPQRSKLTSRRNTQRAKLIRSRYGKK